MKTDILRPDHGNRGFLAACLKEERTASAAVAFSIGERIQKHPQYTQHANGIIALFAAGYKSLLADLLESEIDAVLANYPNRSKVEKRGMLDDANHPLIYRLRHLLANAVALPMALSHLEADFLPGSISTERRQALYEYLMGAQERMLVDLLGINASKVVSSEDRRAYVDSMRTQKPSSPKKASSAQARERTPPEDPLRIAFNEAASRGLVIAKRKHISVTSPSAVNAEMRHRRKAALLSLAERVSLCEALELRIYQPTLSPRGRLTVADIESLAWMSFVDRLSFKARRDPVLQLHFSTLRETVDEYRRLFHAVPHLAPRQ